MDSKHLIRLEQLCSCYEIEISFFHSLDEAGLLHIVKMENDEFIDHEHLDGVERLIRLHRELDINLGGLEAVTHLLDRVHELQNEIFELKNKLKLYE
jgi:chaperone modulatory protein CbpM